MFHSFFNSLPRSKYLSFFTFFFFVSLSFNLLCRQPEQQSPQFCKFSFFLCITRSGRLTEIRWSVCISKPQESLCVSFSRTVSRLCIYHLSVWSNFNFLHNGQWIILPTPSCLVLYSFCTYLLHSLIMWLIISFQSTHNHICCFEASYLFLLWYYWSLWCCFVVLLEEIL